MKPVAFPSPSPSVTIRDVAREAGVSPGTVSRVLNNSPLISEATRLRVLEVVEQMGYTPNLIARRLSTGKTLTIAVIAPFFTRPAFVERLNGVVSTLAQSQYDVVLYNVQTPEQRDTYFRDVPRRERADGVLIMSLPPTDEAARWLQDASLPIVLIDSSHPTLDSLSQVVTDDFAGGRAATEHLLALGHRAIGFIGDPQVSPFNFVSSKRRYLGYRAALESAGIAFQPAYYQEDQHGRFEARRMTHQLLKLPQRPTAVFAASDTQAMGALQAAADWGLNVPQDLSVIGYDDIEVAEYLGLTTIRQLLFESGQRGVELLLERLENPQLPPVHEVLASELVVRRSTAAPVSISSLKGGVSA